MNLYFFLYNNIIYSTTPGLYNDLRHTGKHTYRPLFSYTSFAQGKHKWVIVNSLKTLKKYKNVQHNIISLNTLTNSIYYTSLTSHWLKLNHMTWNNFNVLWKLTQTGNNPIVPQKGNKLFRKFQNIHKISKF